MHINTELMGIVFTFLVTLAIAFPLGRYIARVFNGEKTIFDCVKLIQSKR